MIGDQNEVCQLVFFRKKRFYTRKNYIVYTSSGVRIRDGPWFKCGAAALPDVIQGNEAGLQYCCISRPLGGKILAICPESLGVDLAFRSECLLGCSSELALEGWRSAGMGMARSKWTSIKGSGIVFVQTPGILIEKHLGEQEEVFVNANCVYGLSQNVQVSPQPVFHSPLQLLKHDWSLIRLKGKGVVYMDPAADYKIELYDRKWRLDVLYCVFFLIVLLLFLVADLVIE